MSEVAGALWLVAGLGTLSAAAILTASCLRLRSAAEFVLAAYVIGWLWLIVVLLGLSPPRLVTRGWFVAGLLAGLAAALVAWRARGSPRPTSFRPALGALSLRAIHPSVLVLGVGVLLGLGYTVALALFTPVNEGDSLAYHLARAAFWKQEQRIGYVPGAVDLRLDVSPPNAEIGQLATLLLAGGDRYVALPQLLAYGALVLGVAAIAKRVGLDSSEALCGALVFACLPIVVVQASGALNDLVVASFLVTAALFAAWTWAGLARRACDRSGPRAGHEGHRRAGAPDSRAHCDRGQTPTRMACACRGRHGRARGRILVVHPQSPWRQSALDGGLGEDADQRVEFSVPAIAVNVLRYGLDLLDMSGTPRARPESVSRRRAGERAAPRSCSGGGRAVFDCSLLGTSALSLIALATPLLAELGRELVFRSWVVLGRPPTPPIRTRLGTERRRRPGRLLVRAARHAASRSRRRRLSSFAWRPGRVPPMALVLSLAPWTLLLTLASAVIWDPCAWAFSHVWGRSRGGDLGAAVAIAGRRGRRSCRHRCVRPRARYSSTIRASPRVSARFWASRVRTACLFRSIWRSDRLDCGRCTSRRPRRGSSPPISSSSTCLPTRASRSLLVSTTFSTRTSARD